MSPMLDESLILPLDEAQLHALRDHVVAGRAVLPAAWMVVAASQALEAQRNGGLCKDRRNPRSHFRLEGVDFLAQLDIAQGLVDPIKLLQGQDGSLVWDAGESGQTALARATACHSSAEWPRVADQHLLAAAPAETADSHLSAAGAYARLAAQGNSYGPAFQVISGIKTEIQRPPAMATATIRSQSMTAALDGCFQLALYLASSVDPRARVVSGLEGLCMASDWPQTVICQVRQTAEAAGQFGGTFDIDAVAPDGSPLLTVKGLRLALASEAPVEAALHIVSQVTVSAMAAKVTELGAPLGLTAHEGPFDQIQQTLLAGAAQLPAGTEELAIVIDPRSWFRSAPLGDSADKGLALQAGATQATLPDGMEVLQLNSFETDYLYAEIFDRGDYRPDGLRLSRRPCVIDIGANIGMFALSVLAQRPEARVIALEPSPVAAPVLRANLAGRGDHVVLEAGGGARDGQMRFTHYTGASVFSGFHADGDDDRKALEAAIRNEVRIAFATTDTAAPDGISDALADQIAEATLEARLAGQTSLVEVVSVSSVIDRLALERVELLKIDAERSEWDILSGIRAEHWPLIDQILVEVHEQGTDDPGSPGSHDIAAFLADRGFVCEAVEDAHLAGSGLSLIHAIRTRARAAGEQDIDDRPFLGCPLGLDQRVDEFVAALERFRTGSALPVQVLVGPLTGSCQASSHVVGHVSAALHRMQAALARLPGCTLHLPDTVSQLYPDVPVAADPGELQAGMRWSEAWQAAAGICLLRAMAARRRIPHKVIMVDADNTLWKGVCAEVGPAAVEVTPGHRLLQQRLKQWRQAGGLLCLVSRNIAADVRATFEQAQGMVLGWDDFAGSRIGWGVKSAAVRALCAELGIGCESAIFIDDNELECAEVHEGVPECLVLQVPRTEADLVDFARHTWAFDPAPGQGSTDRTEQARIERVREEARASAPSLADFLAGLQLVVDATAPSPGDFERLSELTRRTNQFNIDPKGYDPEQLRSLAAEPGRVLLSVRVRDRFGDYGLVGLISARMNHPSPEAQPILDMDLFLLSCRVLGRGVEQRVLAALLDAACGAGEAILRLRVRVTERNAPVRTFLEGLEPEEVGGWWQITASAERRAQLLQPASWFKATAQPETEPQRTRPPQTLEAGRAWSATDRCYRDPSWITGIRIACATDPAVSGALASGAADAEAGDSLQAVRLAWQAALGRPCQTVNEDFFAAGGSSLQLVRLLSHLYRHGWPLLSVAEAYAAPTVAGLALALDRRQAQPVAEAMVDLGSSTPASRSLSMTEQGLWFEYHRDPDSPVYATTLPILIEGPVSMEAVRDAWLAVCGHHAGLRTYYELDGAESRARVRDSLPDAWVHDPHLVLAEGEIDAWIDELAQWPLDIEYSCAQAHFVRTGTGPQVLVLRLHHIIADLEAIGLVLNDLCRMLAGEQLAVSAGHGRFAARVSARTGGGLRPRTALAVFDIGWQQDRSVARVIAIPAEATARLRALAAEARVSLQALLMAGLATAVRPGLASPASAVSIGTPVRLHAPSDGPAAVGNHVSLAAMAFGPAAGTLPDLARSVHAWLGSLVTLAEEPGLPQWVTAEPDLTLALHNRADSGPVADMVLHGAVGQAFPFGPASARILGRSPQAGQVPVGIDVLDQGATLSICVKSSPDRAADSLKVLAAFSSLLMSPVPGAANLPAEVVVN